MQSGNKNHQFYQQDDILALIKKLSSQQNNINNQHEVISNFIQNSNSKTFPNIYPQLLQLIESSKNSTTPNSILQASLAITTLNYMNYNFQNINLNNIKIPNADLSSCILKGVSFKDSDCSNVNFEGSDLEGASFMGTNLKGAQFGNMTKIQKAHSDETYYACMSPDCSKIATCGTDKKIRIWDSSTSKKLMTLRGHTAPVCTAFFIDNLQLISGGDDDAVKIWDLTKKECAHTLTGHTKSVYSVKVSKDKKLIASGGRDDLLKLWDMATKQCIASIKAHTSWIMCVQFSPDSRQVVSSSVDNTIRVWDTHTYRSIARMKGHTSFVIKVEFSKDGHKMASISYDKTINIWNAHKYSLIKKIKGFSSGINYVSWTHDSQQMIVSTNGSSLLIINFASGAIKTRFVLPKGLHIKQALISDSQPKMLLLSENQVYFYTVYDKDSNHFSKVQCKNNEGSVLNLQNVDFSNAVFDKIPSIIEHSNAYESLQKEQGNSLMSWASKVFSFIAGKDS